MSDGPEPDAWMGFLSLGGPTVQSTRHSHPLPEIDDKDVEPLFRTKTIHQQIKKADSLNDLKKIFSEDFTGKDSEEVEQ